MNLKQMTEYVIDPALKAVDLYSPQASRLLLLTGWVESRYKYVAQVGGGPARSFWQVEPSTADDHYKNYLNFRQPLFDAIADFRGFASIQQELVYNMGFAVIMARLKYRRNKMALPMVNDLEGQAFIWKKVYNTHLGSGTEEKFIEMCQGLSLEEV